jgi:hypothetical protein
MRHRHRLHAAGLLPQLISLVVAQMQQH